MPTRSTSATHNPSTSSDLDFESLTPAAKKIVLFIREDLMAMKVELLDSKSQEIDSMKAEIRNLKTTVSRLEEKLDDSDSYERRDTVILSGDAIPPATSDEVCRDLVVNIVKEKLKINIASSDISTAHRVGKRPISQRPDNRKIVVKLCRRDIKRDLMYSRRNLKPEGLFISESLTPSRNTIMFVLRRIRRAHPNIVKGCTSIDGRVFVYVASESDRAKRLLVNSHQQLIDFCDDIVKVSLINFIDSWPH